MHEWHQLIGEVPVGQSRRFEADCGEGRPLSIYNYGHEVHAWCFRCGPQGIYTVQESFAERMERMRSQEAAEDVVKGSSALPLPPEFKWEEWPVAAQQWLLKAGITEQSAQELGIYYHQPTRRVVIPIIYKGEVVYWQARSVGGGIKYINPKVSKAGFVSEYGEGSVVVLTEDMLSTFKVAKVTKAICLLGTKLNDKIVARLRELSLPIKVWLDPDAAGRDGALSIVRHLTLLGMDIEMIYSEEDPKAYAESELNEFIFRHQPVTSTEISYKGKRAVTVHPKGAAGYTHWYNH